MLKNTGRLPTSAACRCRRDARRLGGDRLVQRRVQQRRARAARSAVRCHRRSRARRRPPVSTRAACADRPSRATTTTTSRSRGSASRSKARTARGRAAPCRAPRRRSTRAPPARAPRVRQRPVVSSSKAVPVRPPRVESGTGAWRRHVAGRGAMLAAYRPMRARQREARAA